jgi:hypothetical protein
MNYKIEFQYKKADSPVPEARVQDTEIRFDSSQFMLLPDVGDTVTYAYGQSPVTRKVITRHFSFIADWCFVNIVVGDLSETELAARLKE